MNIVIVPSHNQGKYIKNIVESYEKQTILPDVLLFVFDRCLDNSLEIIKSIKTNLNLKWVIKDFGENFSAGMTRDFGVEYIQDNYSEYNMIIFTDGDCIASETLVQKHSENCSQTNIPIVSCGKRFKETIDGKWEEDERLNERWVNEFSFTDRNSRVIISNSLTLENILTYSCNFAFNKFAIEVCQQINEKISNSKRVFNLNFDGSWGCEDNFISHCIFRVGGYILLTDHTCFVSHFYHEEAPRNNKKKNIILKKLSKKLEDLILKGDIDGPIQIIKKGFHISFCDGDVKNEIKNIVGIDNVDSCVMNYIDFVCDEYKLNQKIIFKYFLTQNCKNVVNEQNILGITDQDICYFKELLSYMKFYLKDGKLEFVDDIKNFNKKVNMKSFLDYA